LIILFRMKTMLGSSLPPVVCKGLMSYLRYLCLFAISGVQHILCFIFCFVRLRFVLCVTNDTSFFLDRPFGHFYWLFLLDFLEYFEIISIFPH
jgi:hypothetical protein